MGEEEGKEEEDDDEDDDDEDDDDGDDDDEEDTGKEADSPWSSEPSCLRFLDAMCARREKWMSNWCLTVRRTCLVLTLLRK